MCGGMRKGGENCGRGGKKCVGMGRSEERCGEVSWVWWEVKEDVGGI